MVLEQADALPLQTWFPLALLKWVIVLGSLAMAGLLIAWLVCAMRHGPIASVRIVSGALGAAVVDLVRISPRRVWALAWLAIRESIRRRVVVVFAVFVVVLLFAGWFLDPGSTQPARLYLSFVLTATSYLTVLLALFLSAMSLPADIKNKTLHTVVTKPVRPSEIVLGRMLGFTAVGTMLLAVMAAISYGFVIRGLSHTHKLTGADLKATQQAPDGQPAPRKGFTSRVHQHRHEATIEPSGEGRIAPAQNHWHELKITRSGGKPLYKLSGPKGMLVARVPVYGKLRFKDRTGKPADKGVNVGDEWTYRSFIEGGTLATAIWTFDGVTPQRFPKQQFPKGLPLEMNIEVFRTYKGTTEDPENIPGIPGSIWVSNPIAGDILQLEKAREEAERRGRSSQSQKIDRRIAELRRRQAELPPPVEAKIFTARDFVTEVVYIPRKLETHDGKERDLFADFVVDGRVEIWLRCVPPAQYFGTAQADVYLRARNASFLLNFSKGYLGIWLQMVLIIGIGVMFSTYLSGPVAVIATAGALVGGLFSGFMMQLARGQVVGGGPFEALVRILLQQNLISELEPGLRTTVVQMLDEVLQVGLFVAASILPAFAQFSFADHVAYGFDISGVMIFRNACRALAFLLPLFVAAYLFLKTREVAK